MTDSPKPRRTRKILLEGVVAAEASASATILVDRVLVHALPAPLVREGVEAARGA
jgi:hypothetical protein